MRNFRYIPWGNLKSAREDRLIDASFHNLMQFDPSDLSSLIVITPKELEHVHP